MGEIYFCSRLRILEWLTQHGFEPIGNRPDRTDPNYTCWLFKRSPQLEQTLADYRKSKEQQLSQKESRKKEYGN